MHIRRYFHLFLEKGARRAPEGPGGPRRGPKRPSAKPKDVGGAFRGFRGALNLVLRPLLLLGILGFFPHFDLFARVGRRGPPERGPPSMLPKK